MSEYQQSESIENLAKALAKVQSEMEAVGRDDRAGWGQKTWKYATLQSCMAYVLPLLTKHGLSLTQTPGATQSIGSYEDVVKAGNSYEKRTMPAFTIGLTTQLMHESGEWIRQTASLPFSVERGNTITQMAGSALTYGRRYALSIIGLTTEEDTDGSGREKHRQADRPERPAMAGGAPPAARADERRQEGARRGF